MSGLITHETPTSKLPTMVVAFGGWPDAAEAATGAVRYLVRKLDARRFAEIDPEEFYDFTVVRPQTSIDSQGQRIVRWQTNEFYYHAPEDESRGLVLYVGTEPNLRWKTFCGTLLDVAEQCGVGLVVSLGALLDLVPHTREPKITGRANPPELATKVESLGIKESGYRGPTGISTVFMDACVEKGLAHASLWGHGPHYITTSPNPTLTHALLAKLRGLVDIKVDLEELRAAGEAFNSKITRIIAAKSDLTDYVQRLEKDYDADTGQVNELPSSEEMVAELEEFLRSRSQEPEDSDDS